MEDGIEQNMSIIKSYIIKYEPETKREVIMKYDREPEKVKETKPHQKTENKKEKKG